MFTEITRKQFAPGTYTNGTWVPGAGTESQIVASVQPEGDADKLDRLPEGVRSRGVVKVYTGCELRTADEETQTPADQVLWDGEWWEVQIVDTWALGIEHFKAICTRVDR
jgi:hypothetical protein